MLRRAWLGGAGALQRLVGGGSCASTAIRTIVRIRARAAETTFVDIATACPLRIRARAAETARTDRRQRPGRGREVPNGNPAKVLRPSSSTRPRAPYPHCCKHLVPRLCLVRVYRSVLFPRWIADHDAEPAVMHDAVELGEPVEGLVAGVPGGVLFRFPRDGAGTA